MLNVMYAVHENNHIKYTHDCVDEAKFLGCDRHDHVQLIHTEKNGNVEVKTTTTIQMWQLEKITEW